MVTETILITISTSIIKHTKLLCKVLEIYFLSQKFTFQYSLVGSLLFIMFLVVSKGLLAKVWRHDFHLLDTVLLNTSRGTIQFERYLSGSWYILACLMQTWDKN